MLIMIGIVVNKYKSNRNIILNKNKAYNYKHY